MFTKTPHFDTKNSSVFVLLATATQLTHLCAVIRTLANDVLVMVAEAMKARETATQADFTAMFRDVRDSIFQICTLADVIEEKINATDRETVNIPMSACNEPQK